MGEPDNRAIQKSQESKHGFISIFTKYSVFLSSFFKEIHNFRFSTPCVNPSKFSRPICCIFSHLFECREIHYDTPNHSPEEFGSDMYQTGNKEKGFLDFLFLSSSFLFLPFFITFFVVSFLWRTLPVSANRQRGLWRLVQRTASTRTSSFTFYFWDMFMPFDKMTPLTGYTLV